MPKAEPEQEPISEPLITRELLEEFKELYRKEFGVKLSDENALKRALNVLQLFEAIYRPIPPGSKSPVRHQEPLDSSDDHPGPASDSGKQLKLF
jgi:hypothetical protein